MKAWEVLGYQISEDHYCVWCLKKDHISNLEKYHPIFASDESAKEIECKECHKILIDLY